MRKRLQDISFPPQNFLREEDLSAEKVLEKQGDMAINGVLTVWQKKQEEEKLRFETK